MTYPNSDKPPRPRARLAWVGALALLATAATAQISEICVLQTTDIHGFIEDSDVLPEGGGWLRLATLIRQQRARAGAKNTLLVDCGDTTQGTLVGMLSQGEVALAMLDVLNYDVWVLGNHELDFGTRRLQEMCRSQRSRVLCSNLAFESAAPGESLPAWRTFRRAGATIAVIGVTASYLDHWFWGEGSAGYRVNDAMDVLPRIMSEVLRTKPDIIVLAAHQGWLPDDPRGVNEVTDVVRRFPEIDLVLGGHTHWQHAGRKIGPKTWYAQAGKHADALSVTRIHLDTATRKIVNVTSEVAIPGPDVPENLQARAAVHKWLANAARAAQVVVGAAAAPISGHGQPGVDCATSELLCAAIAEATGADVVIHGRLSRDGLAKGPINEADMFRIVPYENALGVARLTAPELCKIMQEQLANRRSYVACGIWGARALVDEQRTVVGVTDPDGQEIRGRVTVAFNSYTLASGGGRFPVLREVTRQPQADLKDAGLSTRDALRDYVRRHNPLQIPIQQWITQQE